MALGNRFRVVGLRSGFVALVGVPLVLVAMHYRSGIEQKRAEATMNFALGFEKPKGWLAMKHDPESLFLFRDPSTGLDIRGAQNQVISETNPTPDLDTEGLVKMFKENTLNNQKGWTAQVLDEIPCQGGNYRLILRQAPDRSVLTAITVRGNTTILITIAAIGDKKALLEKDVPTFRDFLAKTSLTRDNSQTL